MNYILFDKLNKVLKYLEFLQEKITYTRIFKVLE